ncbi:hydroxymethylglutaryl-CoA synthase family protein [Nocardia panacis]|uniref:Hydroxymethylglutaryl-CoA synthase family protein n=1 Tax=Nocardia panacis TaxID=2340916 RepID=A0A3A4JVX6_9NOCA|nr:hydroxymethylglutaryl-CoA synthase [Nocardia panacis]RJO70742.1 hydroxymethylglutaryl-CoA synthase family protein [Nocardia panacis]
MRAVGIEAASVYVGQAVVGVPTVFEGRGLDASRYENLMMRTKSVALPWEDPVTNAVNAARPIIEALSPRERDRIEYLAIGTESGIDLSKTIANYVQRHLGLSNNCGVFEVKQACYAAFAALETAVNFVAVAPRPGTRALVINADIPHPVQGTYYEPSQGMGSVAILLGDHPELAVFEPGANGHYTFEVMDSCRPRYTLEVVDTDVSLLAYLECLEGAFLDYAAKKPGTDIMRDFELLCMHTPFGGMVKGAHRSLLRKLTNLTKDQIDQDFLDRVEPSIRYGMRIGNIYSGSVFLALTSALAHSDNTVARRIGAFSYGSGCGSQFTGITALPGPAAAALRARIDAALDRRVELDWDTYARLADLAGRPAAGTRDATVDADIGLVAEVAADNAAPRLVLTGISDYRREYRWEGRTP